ncbi:MAG: radical SAM protein [Planctomycetales bacterium]|nr:radical SAM protein [Planctomycetales bacterium]
MNAPTDQMRKRVRHRDYTFLGLTQSLCPECHAVVPAKIIARGKRVYFRKKCPTHGHREDFVCSDVARYDRLDTSLPAKLPATTFTQPNKGCPFDCGLCTEHEQHTCIGVIEITDGCNLTCPMCYAGSAPGRQAKSVDDIKRAIDALVAAEGRAEVIQLSGGEPTLHPHLLEIVDYALKQPVDYVMINTNGIRLAHDVPLVAALAEHRSRLEIYFQFDSLDDGQVAALRGQTGLVEIKLKALERLAAAQLNVTLVATLQGGVNESAAADLLDFASNRPEVTGLSFQPATYSGRYVLPEQLEKRITFPDVIDSIAADSRNEFAAEDFFPLPCAHPNCHWLSLAVRDASKLRPITKLVDVKQNLDLLANGISFTRGDCQKLAQQVISRMACGESGCCTAGISDAALPIVEDLAPHRSENELIESFLKRAIEQTAGARDMLRITVTSFLDAYNFDVRRVMKCCTHHVLPSGHIIPFCAYNVLYRDGKVPLPELS